MILLENDYISASFSSKGAELQTLKNRKTGIDYLWNGDRNYWGKFSPVLFPIVGGLRENTYYFEDRKYSLPRHGFARDHEFDLEKISDDELLFVLTANPATLENYPFNFRLALRYRLSENSITCSYEVTNIDHRHLLFSIGGHPAFAVPAETGLDYKDYYLKFSHDTELEYHKISKELITDETISIPLIHGRLSLSHELFYADALVFKKLKSDSISILNTQTSHGLKFEFKEFPFFGIWAAKDANFVCLEPWCGIADGINHNMELKDKEGIQSLPPGQVFKRQWQVSCF